jgi:hypothetical protein
VRFSICLIASLCLSSALVSCNRKSATGVEIDPTLKDYILPKAKVLAGISLDRIKQTDFYQRHAAQLQIPQLNQVSQEIGMDPRRDLSSFLMAWNGTETLNMVHGTFQPEEIEKHLRSITQAEKYNKLTLFGDGKRDVVFLPKGVALIGPAVLLKRAVNEDAAGGHAIPEDLQLQLDRIHSGAQAWLVSSGVIPLEQLSMRSDAATTLSNISDYIDAIAAGITFGSGASVDANFSCISEEGSQRVHDALRGVIGLARLSTPDGQLDQLRIWDSIHVDRTGKEVHVSADLTPELADKLITSIPALARRF